MKVFFRYFCTNAYFCIIIITKIMKPNDILTLDIQAIGDDGDGIATLGKTTVYIPDTMPGDRVRATVADVAKTYAHATLSKVIKPSQYRIKPNCQHVGECGGCQVQEMDYHGQLLLKRQKVTANLQSEGVKPIENVSETIGCKKIFNFRNKAIYPVAKNTDGQIVAGFYARRSHLIVPSRECPVGAEENTIIVNIIIRHLQKHNIEPYDEATHTGSVRYIMIRKAFATNAVMVSVITTKNSIPYHKELIDKLLSAVKSIKDISITVNDANTNRIRGNEVITLHGDGYITDMIGDIKFRISPLSFYQVNAAQTEVLYSKALEFAMLTGKETVFDLYCGVGTISLFLARHSQKVYGVESISQAVDDARQNAKINNISNVEFIAGKVEDVIPELVNKNGVKADVVVVDPPRKGCDKVLIDTIIKMRPARIVYVSCESKSLARDLRTFADNGFTIQKVQPVDMFPHTVHVETVALLAI